MTTRLLPILTILILTGATGYSQNFEPLDLAKQIFGKNNMPAIDHYVTGEYQGQPNGQDLQKGAITRFLLLYQGDKKAAVAMTILDSAGNGLDTYLHFEKDSIWKMNAFRALAMTGIIEQVKNELEKLTPKQVDNIVESAKENKNDKNPPMFASKEDYEFQLGNTRLTLELDDKIIDHFLKNKDEFERIKDAVLIELQSKNNAEESNIKLGKALESDYRKLYISSITVGGYEFGNCLNFLIGGLVDNSVGYIFVRDKKDLPEMDPGNIIMLREIGNGWYIYKTT